MPQFRDWIWHQRERKLAPALSIVDRVADRPLESRFNEGFTFIPAYRRCCYSVTLHYGRPA